MVAGEAQQLGETIADALGWHAGELGQQQADGARWVSYAEDEV